jgi:hypothetical protein
MDVPQFLRISKEDRAAAWVEYYRGMKNPAADNAPVDDRGPGAVCRRLGIRDGINKNFVDSLRAQEEAERLRKRAESLEKLAAWKSRKRQETAEMNEVRVRARAQHRKVSILMNST